MRTGCRVVLFHTENDIGARPEACDLPQDRRQSPPRRSGSSVSLYGRGPLVGEAEVDVLEVPSPLPGSGRRTGGQSIRLPALS